MGSRTYEWADADILYYVFTEASGYAWNHPELTDALVVAREENDPDARVAAYEAVSEILSEDFKGIALFSENNCIAVKSNVQGLVVPDDGLSWFGDVTKE